jgi:phage gp36-like protein
MSAYYSTQATIEARISALRLAGFTDRNADSLPDTAALEAGFKEARGIIRGYIFNYAEGYDYDISVWTDTTVPELIQSISDKLCIKMYYSGNPRFQDAAKALYDEAIALLESIRDGKLEIYEIASTGTADTAEALIESGRISSEFDPEREYDDMSVKPDWILPDARKLENY